jgi:Flp pilus assembly protein TadG
MKIVDNARETAAKQSGRLARAAAQRAAGRRSDRVSALARLFRSEQGGSLVEFALVLPMMMVVITGTFAFGLALASDVTLTQATGLGAQYLQTIRSTATDPCGNTLTAIEAAAPNLKASDITISVSINGGSAYSGPTCTSALSSFQSSQGEPITISTSYPCSLLVYALPYGSAIGRSCTLSAKVTEYEY